MVSIRATALACLIVLIWVGGGAAGLGAEPARIEIVDSENGWPVPLVELRTTHGLRFVSDNAGVIAMDAPELLGQETFFHVKGHGYVVPEDGFGFRGIRVTPLAGKTTRIEVERINIAKRLGRLTGAGLFAESQQLGAFAEWKDAPLVGQDSVQLARYKGELFWAWGDTTLPHYPLGVFHMTAATTPLKPFDVYEPPLKPRFEYFVDNRTGRPRGVARMAGEGPTWLSGLMSLKDRDGCEHLVATYAKIRGSLDVYEKGLCEWDDETQSFKHRRVLWKQGDDTLQGKLWHNGHPVLYTDDKGKHWVLICNPYPQVKFPATYEAWDNPATWQACQAPAAMREAESGNRIKPHRGSIAYNAKRERWLMIFTQLEGSNSRLGEIWYAEADDPLGDWGSAVKVLTHANYSFYNPRIHAELTEADDSFIVFEGTYTALFADDPAPTPRYDYNQVIYRLDLDDPALKPAQRP